jgi:hypothetical protein
MPDRYRVELPRLLSGYIRVFTGRIRSDAEALNSSIGLTATSTGQRSLRVTFAEPLVRVPTLSIPGAWSVRRGSGESLVVLTATPEPGVGPVSYVDLTTEQEQSAGADDVVELYGFEVA